MTCAYTSYLMHHKFITVFARVRYVQIEYRAVFCCACVSMPVYTPPCIYLAPFMYIVPRKTCLPCIPRPRPSWAQT